MPHKTPLLLMILDGWGIRPETTANAVKQARTPTLDHLLATCPHTRLDCSGQAVGLPPGVMGNSEVGHLNIGAGRIVYQDLLKINRAIEDRSILANPALSGIMETQATSGQTLHLMGLVSEGGVHSHLDHLLALVDMAAQKNVARIAVHAILDGRDAPPDSGRGYVTRLQQHLQQIPQARLATICGRYWAMDRDKRWDRTAKAYALYTQGSGTAASDPVSAIEAAYARQQSDEFVEPIILNDADHPMVTIQDGDGIIFFNFRADRARQITRAFTQPGFDGFLREKVPQLTGYVCLTLYEEGFDLPVAFPPDHLQGILGEVISRTGRTQLRIAETEKYAHVTYFFNGGEETPFTGEERCMIPSPKDVPTYDHKPEMSAQTVTDTLLARLTDPGYDLVVLNFANMDMVGHTGNLTAAIKACETVDRCVAQILDKLRELKGTALITADHGNAELMAEPDGRIHTAHTLNQVPLVLVSPEGQPRQELQPGKLGDIAPTILALMGLTPPPQMTGVSLLTQGQ